MNGLFDGRWRDGWWERVVNVLDVGGVDRRQKACLPLKFRHVPLGTLQCVGQPQGVLVGGPQGAEENVHPWP